MKNLCYITLFLLLGYGCQFEDAKVFKEFPKEIHLAAKSLKTSPVLMMPMEILMLDGAIIVMDLKADYFFHLFSYPDFQHLGGFIRRGRGPSEEIFVNPFIHKTSDSTFFYQTINGLSTIGLNPDGNSLIKFSSIELPAELNYFDFPVLFKIGHYYYGASIGAERKEFESFNPVENRLIAYGSEYPHFKRGLMLSQIKTLSDKVISVRPDEKKFASAHLLFPIIRIYNSNSGKVESEIRYENDQLFPEAFVINMPTTTQMGQVMNNYRKIKSTEKHIYALYVGKTNDELPYSWTDASVIGNHSNEIHVFDWDGKQIKRIFLDQVIFSFDISSDDKTLIASSINSLDELYYYTLKWN